MLTLRRRFVTSLTIETMVHLDSDGSNARVRHEDHFRISIARADHLEERSTTGIASFPRNIASGNVRPIVRCDELIERDVRSVVDRRALVLAFHTNRFDKLEKKNR